MNPTYEVFQIAISVGYLH